MKMIFKSYSEDSSELVQKQLFQFRLKENIILYVEIRLEDGIKIQLHSLLNITLKKNIQFYLNVTYFV